jgi:GNAT superfamily N-acetyltransferase
LPEYSGRGIGRELLRRWEGFLRKRKAERYYVNYDSKNKLAKDLHLRNGFVRTGS